MNATPRQLAAMKSDLSTAQLLQKKSNAWDEEHGLGYHLTTLAMLPFATLLFPLIMMRLNPYKGAANCHFMRYRQTHDTIAKANGLPTFNENIYGRKARRPRRLLDVKASAAAAPARPATKTASAPRPAFAL